MTSSREWADVASAIVGAPSGFKLYRHSPLGWKHASTTTTPSLPLRQDRTSLNSRFLQRTLSRSYPTFWFANHTPCAREYELKNCRHVLSRSAVEAVERWHRDNPQNQPNLHFQLTETERKQVLSAAYSMASNQRIWIIRIMAFVVTKFLNWLFGTDIYIDESAIKTLQTLQKTHAIIYAPTHKSHLDSVIMGYTMFAYGLEPPHIVAGDNLQLPFISFMMRGSGAFFIRRTNKNGKDRDVYKKTLAGFVEALLWHRKHIEFFIEGGRSRDGSVMRPKLGILSNVVDAFIDADLPKSGNVAVVPVHISYDHPFEERAMIRELMGQRKEKETLWGFTAGLLKLLYQCWMQGPKPLGVGGWCGCATIAFGKPIHLKMLYRSLLRGTRGNHAGPSPMAASSRLLALEHGIRRNDLLHAAFPPNSDERYGTVSVLGRNIQNQLRRISVIPASSILYCAIFLRYFGNNDTGRRISVDEMFLALSQFQQLLKENDAQLMSFDTEYRKTTLKRICRFVERLHNWVEFAESSTPRDRAGFSIRPRRESSVVYFIRSNHIAPQIAPMALLTSALLACLHGFDQDQRLVQKRSTIISATLWLREILSPELDNVLGEDAFRTHAEVQDCLDRLISEGVLTHCIPPASANQHRASSVSSSAASGTQGSQRRSVEFLIDKLITGVMKNGMDTIRSRPSMQFESDLMRVKNMQEHRFLKQSLPSVLSATTVPSIGPSFMDQNRSLQTVDSIGRTEPTSNFISFAGNAEKGYDFYFLFFGPLIATYIDLFNKLSTLFRHHCQVEEKELVQSLMMSIVDSWEVSASTGLGQCPIPCLTIVQRFVAALKVTRLPREDFPFTPYPMLMAQPLQGVAASRPPRPSLSNDRRGSTREMKTDNLSSVMSVPESTNSEPMYYIRREFREGRGIVDYSTKLELFLSSHQDALL